MPIARPLKLVATIRSASEATLRSIRHDCALSFGLVVILIITGCGAPEAAKKNAQDFSSLWGTSCAGCHGKDGTHGPGPPLNDALYLRVVSDDDLREAIAEGRPGSPMPAFAKTAGGTLTDAEVNTLVKGIRHKWSRNAGGNESLPTYRASNAGDIENGRRTYMRYCFYCHGLGRGKFIAGPVTDASYLSLASDQWLRTVAIIGRPDLGMPDYRNRIPRHAMTDQEITDVSAWLASQRPRSATVTTVNTGGNSR